MKKLLFLFLFTPLISVSQDNNPVLTISGVEPIVVNVPDKNAEEIYQNIKKWVTKSYRNPDKVLKADIPNEQIRINGYNSNFFQGKGLKVFDYAVSYMLTLDIKDNKYRLSFTSEDITFDGGTPYLAGTKWWFKKKDGSLKKGATLQYDTFNESLKLLNFSIYSAATGVAQKVDDDW